jgi:hypothetical protein
MSQATDMLAAYLAAETALLQGQTVRFGDRLLTRANLAEIQAGRREWERRVATEQRVTAGGAGNRYLLADFSDNP